MTEPNEQDLPEPDDTPLAADESEAAEAEEAEQAAPAPEGEPDAEAEAELEAAAQGTSDTEWERRFTAIGRSFGTYERALEKQLGDDADDYCRCPMCLGETPGFLNRQQAGRFPDEQADVIKQFLGLARPVDYPSSSQHNTCPECEGLGKVTTGSRVPGKETITCPVCLGQGYRGPAPSAPAAATNGSEGVTGPTVYGDAPPPSDRDEWDQPRLLPDGRENPNYGKMPNHWIQVEGYGDTRGLTAQDVARA